MTGNSSIDLSVTNVWRAWRAFRRAKKPSRAILLFEATLELNLLRLCRDLNNDSYAHGGYDHKIVNEKKRRDIAVAGVADRVVHRLLYDYLVPLVDKRFDYDVWSCREGKGLHQALQRVQKLLVKHPTAWIWRADIRKFFDSVPHDRLLEVIGRTLDCESAKKLLEIVVVSYSMPANTQITSGLPIGNLTSQILANLYLNEFDVFVRTNLKPLEYLRYGDDFIMILPRKDIAESARKRAAAKLEKLGLAINSKQDIIIRSWQGLHFLGHVIGNQNIRVERKTAKAINRNIALRNITTYRSLLINEELSQLLPWLIRL